MKCDAAKTVCKIVGVGAAATAGLAALNARIARSAEPLTPAIDGQHAFYDWDGGRVAYTKAGAGQPMLLLHSHNAAASSYEMRRAFAAFAGDYQVFAPDLPGYGMSERRSRPYTAQTYVRFIHDFLQDVVGEPAVIVASSVTAAQVLAAAADDGHLMSHLVLIAPTGLTAGKTAPPPASALMGRILHVPVWGKALFNGIVSHHGIRHFEESHVYENPWNVTHSLVNYAWTTSHQPNAIYAPASFLSGALWVDAREPYAAAPCPLLLVWGDRDKINPYADSAPLLSWNSNARVSVIKRSGAVPQDEQPEEFAAVVRHFLNES